MIPLPQDLVQRLIDYLATRPALDVFQLLADIRQAAETQRRVEEAQAARAVADTQDTSSKEDVA